jgi:hypothetical protein
MSESNKRQNEKSGIKEKDFKRLIRLLDKLQHGVEILYYLINSGRGGTFTVSLISASNIKLKKHISQKKRSTDILIKIEKKSGLYALICQDTEVDGGYYFMQRLVKTIHEQGGTDIYCAEVGIKNTDHKIQEIIFRLLNMYQRTVAQKEDGEISYYALR